MTITPKELVDVLKSIKWKSADRDNMEFTATITCWQMDDLRAAIERLTAPPDGEVVERAFRAGYAAREADPRYEPSVALERYSARAALEAARLSATGEGAG